MHVPDGWFNYSRFGTPIRGTKIISMKTPLKKAFNNGKSRGQVQSQHLDYHRGVPTEEEFTPTQLVERLKAAGWNLRAVIDLTYTSRYYNPKELQDLGILHSKIFCPGKEIPNDEVYSNFSASLSDCLTSCENNDLVAVHCTHGLNRTGYLVCRYLIENCQYSTEDAIQAFNIARGYDIERKNYLEHLRKGCPLLPPTRKPSHQFQGSSKRQHGQTGAHHLPQEQTLDQHTSKRHRRRKRRPSCEPQSDPVPVPLFPDHHLPHQGPNPIPNVKKGDQHLPPTSHDHSRHKYSSERGDKFQSRNARKNKKHRKRSRSPYIPPQPPPSRHDESGRSIETATGSCSGYYISKSGNCMEPEGLRPRIPSHGGAKFQQTVRGYQPLLPVCGGGWGRPRPEWSPEVGGRPQCHDDITWNDGYSDPCALGRYSRDNPYSWHRQDKVVDQCDNGASP